MSSPDISPSAYADYDSNSARAAAATAPTSYFKTNILQKLKEFLTVRHEHTVDPKTMETLSSLQKTINATTNAAQAGASAVGEVLHNLFDVNIPTSLKGVILTILRAVPFILSEDARIDIALMAIFAAEGGALYSGAIYGIAWLVKQVIKRTRAPAAAVEPQADEVEELEAIEEETSLGALYNLIHYYTIGSLPNDTKSFVKALAAANIMFTFIKNIDTFSAFIVRFVKTAINWIWHATTGTYYFDAEQLLVVDLFHAIADEIRIAEKHGALTGTRIKQMVDKLDKVVISATNCGAPRDFIQNVVHYTTAFKNRSVNLASDAAYESKKPPAVGIALIGGAGVGKTSCLRAFSTGLARLDGIETDTERFTWTYQPGANFQPPLPPRPLVAIFDDLCLVKDENVQAEAMTFLMRLGSDIPTVIDQPYTKNVDFADFSYIFLTGNSFTNTTSNDKAFYRRFNGGMWVQSLNPDFADEKGIFDENKAYAVNASYDDIWRFTTPGDKRTYVLSDLVAIAHKVRQSSSESHARRKQVAPIPTKDLDIPAFDFMKLSATEIERYITTNTPNVKGSRRDYASNDSYEPVSVSTAHVPVSSSDSTAVHSGSESDSEAESEADRVAALRLKNLVVTQQSFVGEGVKEYVVNNVSNPQAANAVLNFMVRSKTQYSFDGHRVLADGKPYSITSLVKIFTPPPDVQEPIDLRIPLREWDSRHFQAARFESFSISLDDAAYEDFSYTLNRSALTTAHGPDSKVGNFNDFCLWATAHPEQLGTNIHVFSLERIRPVQSWADTHPVLFVVLASLGGSIVGMLFAAAVKQVLMYVAPQAYSVKTVVRNPRNSLLPVAQGRDGDLPVDGIMNRLARNTVPAVSLFGTKTMSFFVGGIVSNLARTSKHCVEGATHMALGGIIGAVFPLRFFATAEDVPEKIPNFIAVVPDPRADSVWLVFPQSVPYFAEVSRYLCHSTQDVNELTGCALVGVTHDLEFVDAAGETSPTWTDTVRNGRIQPGKLFPLGNVDIAANYDDADNDGLFIDTVTATRKGDCGKFVITTNTRVGRSVRICPGQHGGYLESHQKAVAIPLAIEQVETFIESCPGVTKIKLQGLVEYTVPVDTERDDWTGPFASPIAQVKNEDAAHVSTRNSIVPTPIYGATHGMEYDDPTGNGVTHVPTPTELPARMREVKESFASAKFNKIPTNELSINIHEDAAEILYHNVVSAAPGYFQPSDKLFTVHQALNGIPEWGVPHLDLNKARGKFPGCNLKNRRDLVDSIDGVLVPKPFFEERVNNLIATYMEGNMQVPWVTANLKPELRPATKQARTTRAFSLEDVVAIRCFAMHIPAAYHAGKLHNRSMVGTDLTGDDAFLVHNRTTASYAQGKHLNDGDAKAFDDSENITVSHPIERVHARMIHDRFPFVPMDGCLAIAMTVRIANLMVGNKVYAQWNKVLSGSFWTTLHNTGNTSSIVMGGAMLAGRPPTVYHLAYGDDFNLEDTENDDIIKSVIAHSTNLGITIQPSNKRSTQLISSTPTSLVRLKRTTYKKNGVVFGPLAVETLAHIGDWYDVKDRVELASPVVAESALREWFQHGRSNFERAKVLINARLLQAGFRTIPLTYDELLVDHLKRGPYSYGVIEKQSLTRDLPPPTNAPHAPTPKAAAPVVIISADTLQNTLTTRVQGQGVGTVTTPDSGTVTQHKLTQYRDDAGMSSSIMTAYVKSQVPNPLKPYPPVGIEGIITREYPVNEFTWGTASSALTIFNPMDFPQLLYNIPTIKEKLSSSKYFRCAVEITARVNGQMSCAGKLGFAVIRGGIKTTDPRVANPIIFMNMPHYTLSASTSVPTSFQIPWCSNNLYDDLPNATAAAGCGTVYPFVINPLTWVGVSPPAGLTVTIYARILMPTVSGFDTAGGPPAAKPRVQLVPLTRDTSSRIHGVTKQSSSSEGFEKSIKGVIDGVTSAVDTVKTVIETAKAVAEVAAFDKPMSVQASQPVEPRIAPSFTHAKGLNTAVTLALAQDIPASTKDRLVGEETPKPTWAQFIGTPGFLGFITITPATAAGTLISEFAVDPTAMASVAGDGTGPWMPTPLAYATVVHSIWRGTLKYLVSLSCPTLQKCTIRITYLPTSIPAGVAVGNDVAGDAMSGVVEICGDKDITFSIPFDRPQPYCRCRNAAPTSDASCNGRIVIQMVTALSSSQSPVTANVHGTIYVAAESDFQLLGYNGPNEYQPTWTLAASRTSLKGVDLKSLKVTKQSATFDLFGNAFPSIAPSVAKDTTGFVSNDTSSGPCDVMRRPHVNASSDSVTPVIVLPDVTPIVPILGGPFSYFVMPFQGWSGSLTTTLVPGPQYPDGIYSVSRGQRPPGLAAHTGQALWCPSVNPIFSVVTPWVEDQIYYSTYSLTAYRLSPAPYVDTWAPSETTVFNYLSVNDDFCLYHFVACPFLVEA